jgi:hypothetical protein
VRLIIAGGRYYRLTSDDLARLDAIEGVTEVVSGGCRGVDKDGEAWARSRRIAIKVFKAKWSTHGPAAGPIRNREMALYGDAVALFPGGRGTKDMHREAIANGLKVFDYRNVPVPHA